MRETRQRVLEFRRFAELWHEESGSSVVELTLVMGFLFLLLIGAVDLGKAYDAQLKIFAGSAAGAAYGTRLPTDTAGMVTAAKAEASDLGTITATATWGCECSDGTSTSTSCTVTPSCGANSVRWVEVDTSYSYAPLISWPGIPGTLALTAKSRVRTSD